MTCQSRKAGRKELLSKILGDPNLSADAIDKLEDEKQRKQMIDWVAMERAWTKAINVGREGLLAKILGDPKLSADAIKQLNWKIDEWLAKQREDESARGKRSRKAPEETPMREQAALSLAGLENKEAFEAAICG